jgi:hypothetical protein
MFDKKFQHLLSNYIAGEIMSYFAKNEQNKK